MTRRQHILETFIARLAAITVVGGFATNAGQKVFLNETPELGPDDPETAIAVMVADDRHEHHGNKILIELPLEVHALAKADIDKPWTASEAVLGDVKKAVERDTHLGGLLRDYMTRGSTSTLHREQGSSAVGVIVPYVLPYSEEWGRPDA